MSGADVVVSLAERILGRSASLDIVNPLNGEVIVGAGQLIDEVKAEQIETAGIDSVLVRSVLTCDTQIGVCARPAMGGIWHVGRRSTLAKRSA
jgi:DNA-directed RNA polymerase subunit beta'